MFSISVSEIAKITGGKISPESENISISKVSKLEDGTSGSLGFFSNPKYEKQLYSTECSAVFVPKDFVPTTDKHPALIFHENPYFAFCVILSRYFNPNKLKSGISDKSFINNTAKIGESVYVGDFVSIGEGTIIGNNCQIHSGVKIMDDCIIGENAVLFPNVVIYPGARIGKNFTAHAGSIIGSDGFGFAPINGRYEKIPQVGNVVIEDFVEIGANCCIDRATMGSTIIKEGTKLDNMVQIAHNVEVGKHTVIASQTGVAGSTKIGDHCVFGGQVGIAGHIEIASGNQFGGQSGITGSVLKTGQKMTGTPAMDVNSYLRGVVGMQKIPNILKQLKELQTEIERLKSHGKD